MIVPSFEMEEKVSAEDGEKRAVTVSINLSSVREMRNIHSSMLEYWEWRTALVSERGASKDERPR